MERCRLGVGLKDNLHLISCRQIGYYNKKCRGVGFFAIIMLKKCKDFGCLENSLSIG